MSQTERFPNLPLPTGGQRLLISDYDGTMTTRDFFECALASLDRTQMPDYWGEYLAGERTHFEALRGIFGELRGGEQAIMDIARQAQLDPELSRAVHRLRSAGWEILIVSAGCRWYIERLLAEQDVSLPIIANPGAIGSDGRLEMTMPVDSLFFSPTIGVDKLSIAEWALDKFRVVAFAGDGRLDEQPARLVPAERRFARGALAEIFTADGTPFQTLSRWSHIAPVLTGVSIANS